MLSLVFFCVALCAGAETKDSRSSMRHELRLGWGDQIFESLVWHNPTYIITTMPQTWTQTYQEDYKYLQHVWAEYQYHLSKWFSFGGMADFSSVLWTDVTRDGTGRKTASGKGKDFWNLALMPTMRCTWFHRPHVNLYSGLGMGFGINGGSEANVKGKRTDAGVAANLTLVGISVNRGRYFCSFDIGGLSSLKDTDTIFLAESRIFNLGIGVRL